MANQNLSEFGEKLFVADADHTFIWDSTALISKRVSRNSWLNSGTLTSDAPVTISQTWNAVGQTFTAFKVNAVSTASAAGSLLADFQLGTVSKLKVDKNGGLISSSGSLGGLFLSSGTDGMEVVGGALFAFTSSSITATINRSAVKGFSTTWDGAFAFGTSNTNANVSGADTILLRDAANTLALRNGTAAQTFRVYNTYTDASNYERAIFSFNSNRLEISTGQAGSGLSRKIDFGTLGATAITFFTNGTNRWGINGNDGHFITAADNSYDIGASGANRPRNVYVGTSIVSGSTIDAPYIRAGSAGGLQMQGRFFISSAADGNIYLTNNAVTDFGRLQFGGTTDTFPAVARDGAGIKFTGAAAGSTAWIKVPPVAVSALPLAATAGAGARAFVNDASSPTFGSAVTGGGAVLVPVYSTGSAWHVG